MKKILSISFALLMLLSGMQLTISQHYCGGGLADSRVSVLGHLASCGMEGPVDQCTVPGNHLDSDCCDNEVLVYAVNDNYSVPFSEFKIFAQSVLQVFTLSENITFHSVTPISYLYTDVSPPGFIPANSVSLPKICVFRI
jgi:hypothetical protein